MEQDQPWWESVPRLGLAEKVRGCARYTADLKRPGMLYGRCAVRTRTPELSTSIPLRRSASLVCMRS